MDRVSDGWKIGTSGRMDNSLYRKSRGDIPRTKES